MERVSRPSEAAGQKSMGKRYGSLAGLGRAAVWRKYGWCYSMGGGQGRTDGRTDGRWYPVHVDTINERRRVRSSPPPLHGAGLNRVLGTLLGTFAYFSGFWRLRALGPDSVSAARRRRYAWPTGRGEKYGCRKVWVTAPPVAAGKWIKSMWARESMGSWMSVTRE